MLTHSSSLCHVLFLGNQQPLEHGWTTEIAEIANDKVATCTHTHSNPFLCIVNDSESNISFCITSNKIIYILYI